MKNKVNLQVINLIQIKTMNNTANLMLKNKDLQSKISGTKLKNKDKLTVVLM